MTVLLGFLVGCFVSIIGGGGASLYLGILTSQLHIPVAIAATTSLLIAFPALFAGWLTQLRVKNIDFHYANQMIIAALPGIIGGTIVVQWIPTRVYHWILAVILVAMGGLVLVKAVRKRAASSQPAPDRPWRPCRGKSATIRPKSGPTPARAPTFPPPAGASHPSGAVRALFAKVLGKV